MTTFNGMDTAQGDAFGQSLREGHARLSDVLGRVRERVRESDAVWHGPDADTFRADGEAMSTGLGDPALERLARQANELLGHVEEQEQASSADGAGGGSADPGLPPGAMADDPTSIQEIDRDAEYGIVDPKVASAWAKMSDEERRKVAQEMVNQELARYGLPPMEINWKEMDSNGYHRPGFLGFGEEIALNPNKLSDPDMLHTIAHEVRHAAQHKAVEHTEWDPWDWETDTEYREMEENYGMTREEIDAWRDNSGIFGYKSPPSEAPKDPGEGASPEERARYEQEYAEYERKYMEYFNQPTEQDARKSGKEFSEGMTMDKLRSYQRDAGVPESEG